MLYFASWKDDFNPDNLHTQEDYDNFASTDLDENELMFFKQSENSLSHLQLDLKSTTVI